jgi:hypothetical protein
VHKHLVLAASAIPFVHDPFSSHKRALLSPILPQRKQLT